MVNAEEIVERTFYICLLQTALKKGLTLNPEDYLPLSQENERRFQADKDAMPKFIPIYGIVIIRLRVQRHALESPLNCKDSIMVI